MLSEKMKHALNEQVNAELYSSYLYLSMAAYFTKANLQGFTRWMEVQALEELTHAMKFFNFIGERGGQVTLTPIDGPATSWKSPLAAFEAVYQHEVKVTNLIHKLVDLAIKEKDHASNNFLQWFVSEQVEEETSADAIVQKLKLVGKDGGGLFMLDQELGQRVFTPPLGTTILAGGAGAGAAKKA
jgi:ferritin